jgi:hypothetical protein
LAFFFVYIIIVKAKSHSWLEESAGADYIYIPPQTPALNKGGACGKALPCSPLARWVEMGIDRKIVFITSY